MSVSTSEGGGSLPSPLAILQGKDPTGCSIKTSGSGKPHPVPRLIVLPSSLSGHQRPFLSPPPLPVRERTLGWEVPQHGG